MSKQFEISGENARPFKVPGENVIAFATPSDYVVAQLLGASSHFEGVAFTKVQNRLLQKFYGFDDARDQEVAAEVLAKIEARHVEMTEAWETARALPYAERQEAFKAYKEKYNQRGWGDPQKPTKRAVESSLPFLRAGATRNLHRFVQRDGLRLMAFLAPYLQPGQDPVKLVAQLCIDAGFDVSNDHDWIFEEVEE